MHILAFLATKVIALLVVILLVSLLFSKSNNKESVIAVCTAIGLCTYFAIIVL